MSEQRHRVNDQQLGDYLLGEADEQTRSEVERAIADDPQLRDRLRRLETVTDTLSDMSGAAWQETLGGEQPPGSPARSRRSWTVTKPGVIAAGVAALALFLAGVGVGSLTSPGATSRRPDRGIEVALRPLAGGPSDAAGTALVNREDRMVLIIHRLPRTRRGAFYEAWLMTSISKLVPIASFRVDRHGQARLVLQLPAPAQSYRYVDISLQQVAAGLGHSAVSVLRGNTA